MWTILRTPGNILISQGTIVGTIYAVFMLIIYGIFID